MRAAMFRRAPASVLPGDGVDERRPSASTSPAPQRPSTQVARPRQPPRAAAAPRPRRERRHPRDGRPAAASAAACATSRPADAGEVLGPLARGVDVEHDDLVGERPAPRRTRAAWRAVREYRCGWKTATTRRGASVRAASSVARDLGRMVRVVVDHDRAPCGVVPRRSKRRPAPWKSRSAAAAAARSAPASRAGGERRGGVARVVGAGDGQRRP